MVCKKSPLSGCACIIGEGGGEKRKETSKDRHEWWSSCVMSCLIWWVCMMFSWSIKSGIFGYSKLSKPWKKAETVRSIKVMSPNWGVTQNLKKKHTFKVFFSATVGFEFYHIMGIQYTWHIYKMCVFLCIYICKDTNRGDFTSESVIKFSILPYFSPVHWWKNYQNYSNFKGFSKVYIPWGIFPTLSQW